MYFDNTEQLRDKLIFVEGSSDDYWFCEGLVFDLFFSANENGPDEKQLSAYLDFQQESILYIDTIRNKAIDYIEREKGAAPKRYHSSAPSVDVVNMNDDSSKATMDIVLSFCTFRFLFYTRWKTWVAKFHGRELISLEPSK